MTNEELTTAILKSAEAIKKDIQPNELLDYITNLQEELYSTNQVVRELLDIQERNEKATQYYYKTLNQYNNKNKPMPQEAVEMFNLLENNK